MTKKGIYKDPNYRKNRRKMLQTWVNEYKMEQGCENCGYKLHPVALDFDHIDSSTKFKSISQLVVQSSSKKRLLYEIEKCRILCANCHRISTFINKEN